MLMLVQPQLDRQFEIHFRGRHSPAVPAMSLTLLQEYYRTLSAGRLL